MAGLSFRKGEEDIPGFSRQAVRDKKASKMNARHILLDIEGTVAPISFVYDVLFPYARSHAEAFLNKAWETDEVQEDVALFRAQAASDLAAELPRVTEIPGDEAGAEAVRNAVLQSVYIQMDQDRKTTALKSLQGKIWKEGFVSGQLKSVLFPDVKGAMESWHAEGKGISIYSSGSVAAQKLFFGYSEQGDLTGLLQGYFDTKTGPKREMASYLAITEAIGEEPSSCLFATDVVAEAQAANEAGLQVVILDRPGNHPQGEHPFSVWRDFSHT